MSFTRIGSREIWNGRIVSAREDRFRYDDGEEADREIVSHPGAVAVVAHDGEHVYLVAQPRESVGETALLELPAGRLDAEGESPLETAKRELAEEIGRGAREWRLITSCYSTPGFADEKVHIYLATDLYDESADSGENERIEVRALPLAEIDATIRDCRDMKTLVGLLWLKAYEEGGAR